MSTPPTPDQYEEHLVLEAEARRLLFTGARTANSFSTSPFPTRP